MEFESDRAAMRIAKISAWVDEAEVNIHRDPEALGWHRVAKVAEEAGEAVGAWLLSTGGNPRKPVGPVADVIEELLDTAIAALGAVEHLTGNDGAALGMLFSKVAKVHKRAGLSNG